MQRSSISVVRISRRITVRHHQSLLNTKTLILPLHPLLLLYNVMPSLFFSVVRWSVCSTVGQKHSLPSFGLRVGWCDLAMCVAVEPRHQSIFRFSIKVSGCCVPINISFPFFNKISTPLYPLTVCDLYFPLHEIHIPQP